ncbi:MAG: hypothetical protein KAG66_03085 [Methylococcales bacterium]|nr:hypothetical protein [Methylococcales bacterium]
MRVINYIAGAVVSVVLAAMLSSADALERDHLGMNLVLNKDWANQQVFADTVKSARNWTKYKGAGRASIDAQGWPTEDADLYVFSGVRITNYHGTYGLRFDGEGSITVSGGTLQNKVYSAQQDQTSAEIIVTNTGAVTLRVSLFDLGDDGVPGTRNVKIMRPVGIGGNTHYPFNALFTNSVITNFSRAKITRFMGFLGANGSGHTDWTDRTPMDYSTQAYHPCAHDQCSFEGNGAATGYAIMLANASNTDMWISMPMLASDDYMTKFAELVKNGDPATGVPPLNANLNVWLELSNEIWNSSTAFYQSKQLKVLSDAYHAAGTQPALNFDGSTNAFHWSWRYMGLRHAELANIWRGVFGDAAMMTRIKPILSGQASRTDVNRQSLSFIDTQMPQPAKYYIYGGGGSTYYNSDWHYPIPSMDSLFKGKTYDTEYYMEDMQLENIDIFTAYGLKRVAYEGGPSQDKLEGVNVAMQCAAMEDPRIGTILSENQKAYREAGGDVSVLFSMVGDCQWAFMYDPRQPNTFKNNMFSTMVGRPEYTFNRGYKVPTIIGVLDSHAAHPRHRVGANSLSAYEWLSYTLRSVSNTDYLFTIDLHGTGQAIIDINGDRTTQILNASQTSHTITATLPVGKNGLRIKADGASNVVVDRIVISQVNSNRPIIGNDCGVTDSNDPTLSCSFESQAAGTVTFSQDCPADLTTAVVGTNNFTFDALSVGDHPNCKLWVTSGGLTSFPHEFAPITIDVTAPVLSIIDPIPASTPDPTPTVGLHASETMTMVFDEDALGCNSPGAQKLWPETGFRTLKKLADGAYPDCDVYGIDNAGNISNTVTIAGFTVDTPPTRSNRSPSGALPSGTASIALSIDTDEAATCKYSTVTMQYVDMPNTFVTTGAQAHSQPLTGLVDGTSYTYHTRCQDSTGNVNPGSYVIRFSVDGVANPDTPILSNPSSIGDTTDTTPPFTFTSDKAGAITWTGGCSAVLAQAAAGINNVTLTELAAGSYTACAVTVTNNGAASIPLDLPDFTVTVADSSPPILSDPSSIGTTTDNTPEFTFTSSEPGDLFVANCTSLTGTATSGVNTIVFDALADGVQSNCSVVVIDGSGNSSAPLLVPPFTVDTSTPSTAIGVYRGYLNSN